MKRGRSKTIRRKLHPLKVVLAAAAKRKPVQKQPTSIGPIIKQRTKKMCKENDQDPADLIIQAQEARRELSIDEIMADIPLPPPEPSNEVFIQANMTDNEDQEMPPSPPAQQGDVGPTRPALLNLYPHQNVAVSRSARVRFLPENIARRPSSPPTIPETPSSPSMEENRQEDPLNLSLSMEVQILRTHMARIEYRVGILERQTSLIFCLINQVAEVVGTSHQYLKDEISLMSHMQGLGPLSEHRRT